MYTSSDNVSPPITVAICTYDRGETLLQTLDSVLTEVRSLSAELLVIDQTPQHPAEIEACLGTLADTKAIRWIRTGVETLTGKRNLALWSARAPILLYLDDDVLVPPDLLHRHLALYTQPAITGVTGQVYQAMYADQPPPLSAPHQGSRPHFHAAEAGPTRSLIGCHHSLRVRAAQAVGGYDECFIASSQCEDFDMADRLTQAGYSLWYDPDLWLIHRRVPTGGTRATTQGWPEWTRTANIFLYLFRHARVPGQVGSLTWRALRTGPIRKAVIQAPHLWGEAWLGLIQGARYGWQHREFHPADENASTRGGGY